MILSVFHSEQIIQSRLRESGMNSPRSLFGQPLLFFVMIHLSVVFAERLAFRWRTIILASLPMTSIGF